MKDFTTTIIGILVLVSVIGLVEINDIAPEMHASYLITGRLTIENKITANKKEKQYKKNVLFFDAKIFCISTPLFKKIYTTFYFKIQTNKPTHNHH